MALSQYLITIINNSDVNKMTVRNIGIVFAPTLNIPAPVFSIFLTEYDRIFNNAPQQIPPAETLAAPASLIPEDVRSPRRQMFSELPTPSYGQTSFYVPDDADHHQAQDAIRANYDTGFIPMIPSYDGAAQRGIDPRRQPSNAQRMTRMLDPNENMRSTKAKRRESSMLFMDMGHRKSSVPRMGDDQSELIPSPRNQHVTNSCLQLLSHTNPPLNNEFLIHLYWILPFIFFIHIRHLCDEYHESYTTR